MVLYTIYLGLRKALIARFVKRRSCFDLVMEFLNKYSTSSSLQIVFRTRFERATDASHVETC
jgi:hypothetical protein